MMSFPSLSDGMTLKHGPSRIESGRAIFVESFLSVAIADRNAQHLRLSGGICEA